MDADEVVHHSDFAKIKALADTFTIECDIVALPVIEYWGCTEKVRIDVTPWKWRLSRNKRHITHGVPSELRAVDSDGIAYALPGTDGCDMIDSRTGEREHFASFVPQEIETLRRRLHTDDVARQNYEKWFNNAVTALPTVFHFSWIDIERKIKLYRDYWSRHWQEISGADTADTAESNKFFGRPWSKVTDDDIRQLAARLKDEMGGWIFHELVDFSKKTAWINCTREPPILD